MNQSSRTIVAKHLKRFWPAILILAMWLWVFWPTILGWTVAGFRDSSLLYYPLFKWIDGEFAVGNFPLWNPYCNFGMPVVGDGSSSVFYPGKLIFFFRILPFSVRYSLFLALHVLLASAGTYWFSRVLKSNQFGATLASIAYAFGGAVIFQVNNCIYLVSAAWLPFALACIWLMYQRTSWRWALGTAICCAMMILGGDPQMCYHVGLIMVMFGFWKYLRVRRRLFKTRLQRSKVKLQPIAVAKASLLLIAMVVVATSLLAAVQIMPSYEWSKLSSRENKVFPRTIYELQDPFELQLANREFNSESHPIFQGLFGEPVQGMHHDHIYQFSQPPWTLAELLVPNFSGKPFPVYQRWVDALPGAERMWTPSLYMGLLVLVLAVTGLRPFSRNRKTAWLARLTIFFALASFGWYGLGWLAKEVWPESEMLNQFGSPTGGVYWFMVVFLPKYITFRYPAKLFVIASLGIAVLAGRQLSCLMRKPESLKLKTVLFIAISVVFVVALVGGTVLFWLPSLAGELRSPDFGLFQSDGSASELKKAMLYVVIVSILVLLAMVWGLAKSTCRVGSLFVALVAVDLLIWNSWLIATVPVATLEEHSVWHDWRAGERLDDIPTVARKMSSTFPYDVTSSSNRLEELVRWQRESLLGKHHLLYGVVSRNSFSSVSPLWSEDKLIAQANTPDPQWADFRLVDFRRWDGENYRYEWKCVPNADDTEEELQQQGVEWTSTQEFRSESNEVAKRYFNDWVQPHPGWQLKNRNPATGSVEYYPADTESFPSEGGELSYVFRPVAVKVGGWITLFGWTVVLVVVGSGLSRRQKTGTVEAS